MNTLKDKEILVKIFKNNYEAQPQLLFIWIELSWVDPIQFLQNLEIKIGYKDSSKWLHFESLGTLISRF